MERARAFAIHIFTASGAALALLAMILAGGGHWSAMFFCLGIALLVDALDGPLAREFKVAQLLPRWSGDTLDLVVDFTTYVFVPAYAIAASGLLPQAISILCGMIIVVTGALYFADREMKTHDNFFQGFPAVWNVAAFYLFVLNLPSWLATAMIVALAALTFVPVQFVHPVRVPKHRALNIALVVVWGLLALLTLGRNLSPGVWVTAALCAIAVYFLASGYLARRSGNA
ncbi:MAG: CDP-alcohol phosphatidyltransferase family protein [Pseudolabrys sp.]